MVVLKNEISRSCADASATSLGDFRWHGFYQKKPERMGNFWANLKSTLYVKLQWLLIGQLLKKLGYFLN